MILTDSTFDALSELPGLVMAWICSVLMLPLNLQRRRGR